jgi:6,7-dimethyl-8-ribityllumazine synthase
MLKKTAKHKVKIAKGYRIAIVASRYNSRYVNSMLRAAKGELSKSKASVEVFRVPGAFEIPVVASALALRLAKPVDAIVCLGVILRGETTHAEHIGKAVTNALMQLQVDHVLPVVHEVLLLENIEQARKRCLDESRNRGLEAAQTAIEMTRVMSKLVT